MLSKYKICLESGIPQNICEVPKTFSTKEVTAFFFIYKKRSIIKSKKKKDITLKN